MASNILRTAFTAGELSPKVVRPDMEQYHYGADKMRNVYVQPQGGFRRRPGTTKQAEIKKLKRMELEADFVTQTDFFFLTAIDPSDTFAVFYERASGFRKELSANFDGEDYFQADFIPSPDRLRIIVSDNLIINDTDKLILVFTGGVGSEVDLVLPADPVRSVPFAFSEEQQYVFVFSPYTLSIYREVAGIQVRQGIFFVPITEEEIPTISFAQQLDSMLVFHKDLATLHIRRQGGHTLWDISLWAYENIPKRNFLTTSTNSTGFVVGVNHQEKLRFENFTLNDEFTILVNGEETKSIVYDPNPPSPTTASQVIRLFTRITSGTFNFTLTVIGDTQTLTTGNIAFSSNQTTLASNVQTALQAILSAGTTVSSSSGGNWENESNYIEVSFGGTEGAQLWSIEDNSLTDDAIPNVTDELRNMTRGHGAEDITVGNIVEAIESLDTTKATPLVKLVSTVGVVLIYSIEMRHGEDKKKFWDFQVGIEDFDNEDNSLSFITQTKGSPDTEAVWSDGGATPRGFPRCGTFYQGALYVAGSAFLPQTLWRSRVGNVLDFDSSQTDADYGFEVDGDTNTVSAFVAFNPGRHLQLFSTAAEFYIPVNADSVPITPTNVALRRTTRIGSKEGSLVFETEGAALFLSDDGKSLREFVFTDAELAYDSNSLSALSPHLLDSPTRLAYKSAVDLDNTNYIYLTNADGSLVVINIQRKENVNAWTLSTTQGSYKDVAVLSEDTFFLVERTLNGAEVILLEKSDENALLDSSTSASGVSVSEVTSGLDYLEGEEVRIIVDGRYYGADTVTGGAIFFTDFKGDPLTVSSWEIGLAFPIVDGGDAGVWVKTLPLAIQAQNGTTIGKQAKVSEVNLSVLDTKSLRVRHDSDEVFEAVDQVTLFGLTDFAVFQTYKMIINGETSADIVTGVDSATQITNLRNALEAMVQFEVGDVSITSAGTFSETHPTGGYSSSMWLNFQNGAVGTLYDVSAVRVAPNPLFHNFTFELTNKKTGSPAIRPRDNEIHFRKTGSNLLGQEDSGFSGDVCVEGLLGWSKRGQISLTQNEPLPMNVTNLVMEVRV